jgi:integrase
MLLSELSNLWIESRRMAGVRKLTLAHYRNASRTFVDMVGGRPSSTVTLDDIVNIKRVLQNRYTPYSALNRLTVSIAIIRHGQNIGEIPMFAIPRDARKLRKGAPFRRIYQRSEIENMLKIADPTLKACILLGLNLGYGNHDCGRLRSSHICGSLVDMVRDKTGVERRGWLWPQTLDALSEVGLPLKNLKGKAIVSERGDYLGPRFRRLMVRAGVEQNGRGFYSMRRTYRTAVDTHPDMPAIDLTMGHTTPGMGARYVAWISDERLRAVSVHARASIFGEGSERDVVVRPPAVRTLAATV